MSKLIELEEKQLQSFRQLAIIGDLHGDYHSLKFALKIVDPVKDGIIFLGDYADRGSSGVEVINTVDSLVRKHPRNVFAIKGNHEDYDDSGTPNFGVDTWDPYCLFNEVTRKEGNWHNYFALKFKPFVDQLPLAIIVPGEALFVHGGISSKIRKLEDLKFPTKEIQEDIIWSDPWEVIGEDSNYFRGIGVLFGPDISNTVCERLGVKRIIRSHEPSKVCEAGGPVYSHDGRILTTSTTTCGPRYKPFILSINPADFTIKCLQISTDAALPFAPIDYRSQLEDL